MIATRFRGRVLAAFFLTAVPVGVNAQNVVPAPRSPAAPIGWRDIAGTNASSPAVALLGDQGADSLYRQARERMNRGEYQRAAELFMEVARRAGEQPLAGDALYWHAYSLYREGSSSSLQGALVSLTRLNTVFPSAANQGDANTLRMRVCGELARRGDAQCAAEVAQVARPARPALPPRPEAPSRRERVTRASGAPQECPAEDDDERIAALNALLQMDADRALPILEKVLARRDQC